MATPQDHSLPPSDRGSPRAGIQPRPRRGRMPGQPSARLDQERQKRAEKAEQERRDFQHAKTLQEQYEVLDSAAGRHPNRDQANEEEDTTHHGAACAYPDDEDMSDGDTQEESQESKDAQVARQLQMELDEQAAAELMSRDNSHRANAGQARGQRGRGQGHREGQNPFANLLFGMVSPPRRGRSQPREQSAALLRNLTPMRGHFDERQWNSYQEEPSSLIFDLISGRAVAPGEWHSRPGFSGDDYESLWNIAEDLGEVRKRGLDKEEINTLPTSRFTPPSGTDSTHQEASGACSDPQVSLDEGVEECKVCMCDFEAGDMLRTLPCMHRYHVECIDEWIKRNAVCPICRVGIKEEIQSQMPS